MSGQIRLDLAGLSLAPFLEVWEATALETGDTTGGFAWGWRARAWSEEPDGEVSIGYGWQESRAGAIAEALAAWSRRRDEAERERALAALGRRP